MNRRMFMSTRPALRQKSGSERSQLPATPVTRRRNWQSLSGWCEQSRVTLMEAWDAFFG